MININNKTLREYLEIILNKKIIDINAENLNKIETISFSAKDILGKENALYFDDLLKFPHLQTLIIDRVFLHQKEIKILKQLKKLQTLIFTNCVFDNENDLSVLDNISDLEFEKCYVEKYNFIEKLKNLKKLVITKPVQNLIFNVNVLKNQKLTTLYLDFCNIIELKLLEEQSKLEELSLFNSHFDISDVSFFNKLSNLKIIYIDEQYSSQLDASKLEIKTDIISFNDI